MKHREAFAAEVQVAFNPKVPLMAWENTIMESYTDPGSRRCKTVICTKTP